MVIEDQMELPRLSSTLRAFSAVAKKSEPRDAELERKLLQKRRRQLLETGLESTGVASEVNSVSWADLVMRLVPSSTDAKFSKLKAHLDKMRNTIAKQFLNEDFNDSSALNEAALFILEKFYENRNPNQSGKFLNLDKVSKKMRERFGQFQRNLFDSCKECLEAVFAELSYLNRLVILDNAFAKQERELIGATPIQAQQKYFGENIGFYSFYDDKVLGNGAENSSEESDEVASEEESSGTEDSGVRFNFPMDATPTEAKVSTKLNL